MTQALPPTLEDLRRTVKADLFVFAKWVLGYTRLDPDIHGPICRLLENKVKKRRCVCIPRGWYKTTLVSIAFPLWLAVNDPNERILLVQNTTNNAVSKLRAIDDTFKKNELFRALFPEILPDKSCVWTQSSMCVRRSKPAVESTFEAAGTKSKLTSRHYTTIIEDDTVAPDLDQMGVGVIMPNKQDIEQAIGFHQNCVPLLEDVGDSRWIVVGTRWYERDLISYVRDHQTSFDLYIRASCEVHDGQLAPSFPAQFSEAKLLTIEEDMGPYLFACLYMNQPTRSEDMVFQKEWFGYWENLPERSGLMFFTSVDPAGDPDLSKRKNGRKKTDWNVVLTTAFDPTTGIRFVVEVSKKKCNPTELLDMLFDHVVRWRPVKVGIESIGYQQSIIHYCKQRMEDQQVFFYIIPLTHNNQNKNLRIQGLQPLIKAKKLLLHTNQRTLQTELENFPLSAHDDESDALAMHLELWDIKLGDRPRREIQIQSEVPDMILEIRRRSEVDPSTDPHGEFFRDKGYDYAFN